MSYTKFLESKQKKVIESGFEVQSLNENLFDFQEFIVKRALKAGKYGIFADKGYQALRMGRKSISIELKKSYFDINVKNHRNAVEQNGQQLLFE